MNVLDFMRNLGDAPPAKVYLFCSGKAPPARMATFEPFLAERALDAFVEANVDEATKDFAYAAFYADETPVENIVGEAQTLPFLAERRVILVRGAERYDTESAAGPLLTYLESPNESTVLLLVSGRVDRRTKFYKGCNRAGEIVECPELNEGEVLRWVREEAKAQGMTIGEGAVREIVGRAGTHLSDVNNALTLVTNYLGEEKTITEEAVLAACADVAEEEIWALTDAIAESRTGKAFHALRRLVDLGRHPDEILGTINWLLKNAYAVATAEGDPGISPFVARKVRPLAAKLGVEKLRAAFALCTDTQFMMRNTGTDSDLAIELLVIKLAAPRRRSA